MTKPCKSCNESIDEAAKKCPKCQAFQRWYLNPQYFGLIFTLPFLIFIFWNTGIFNRADFANYKDKFTVSVVRDDSSGSSSKKAGHLITVKVENRSNKKWKDPTFQIESLDSTGTVVAVEHSSEYSVIIAPNSSVETTIELRITPLEAVASHRVSLTGVDSDRF